MSSCTSHLNAAFVSFPSSLKVCHVNAQSLPAHIDEFKLLFTSVSVDVILVSESWLKPSLLSEHFELPGFTLLRNDRLGKAGGGVAAYIRSELSARLISASPQIYSHSPEFLLFEIKMLTECILIGAVYRPPKAGRLSMLEDAILNVMHAYQHLIILGDFNADLLKDSFESRQLKTMLDSLNFTILPSQSTFHTPTSDSLLDLIAVSDSDNVLCNGQTPCPDFSWHDLVYVVYQLQHNLNYNTTVTYRDFKNFNLDACLLEAVDLPWYAIQQQQNIDDKIAMFNCMISSLFDKYIPERTVHTHRKPCPWFNNELSLLRRERDKARRTYLRTKCEVDLRRYKGLRNRFKSNCRSAKLSYYHTIFQDYQPASVLWSNVRRMGAAPSKARHNNIQVPLDDLNRFFAAPLPPPSFPDRQTTSNLLSQFSHVNPPDKFFFSYVYPSQISAVIRKMSKNSKGIDDIPILFYKKILPVILPPITHIFNFSLQMGVFPNMWKYSIIHPIPKKTNPTLLSDYRGISILCSISKALERIVHGQVTNYLNSINFFGSHQSGFRSNHSTSTALLRITDDIRAAMDQRLLSLVVSFDFTKAFDNVSHAILLKKLETQCNFSSSSISWFSSYMIGRHQAIKKPEGGTTDWMPVVAGVPQGSILGPLLFSIYINNISQIPKHSSYHLYADDLVFYSHFPLTECNRAVSKMNFDISSLLQWSRAHCLTLNPDKSKCILVGYRRLFNQIDLNALPRVFLDNTAIDYQECIQLLGVYIDSKLSWTPQVNAATRRVFAAMHQLKRLRRFIPTSLRITLVRALILPLLDYCCIVYNDMSDELNTKLQRSFNYAVRYIFNARRDAHISPYFDELHWLKLKARRQYFMLCLVYNLIMKNTGPQYLRNSFTLVTNVHSRSTRSHAFSLQIPHHRTTIFNSSFLVSASRFWNALPLDIISSDSNHVFKRRLHDYLLGRNE
jgi:hypothetical protein